MTAATLLPPEQAVEEINAVRERMRAVAREALGVPGADKTTALREGMRRAGVGWYPLVALSALVVVDQLQAYAFIVLGPEISSTLGISQSALAGLNTLKVLAITLATLPTAAFIQKHGRRGLVSIVNAFLW